MVSRTLYPLFKSSAFRQIGRVLRIGLIGVLLSGCGVSAHGSGSKPAAQSTLKVSKTVKQHIAVKDFARKYGFTVKNLDKDRVELKGNKHRIVLIKYRKKAEIDGVVFWLHSPVQVSKGNLYLHQVDVWKALAPVLDPMQVLAGQGRRVVVIDPGHGGKDGGAKSAKGKLEKDYALDIAVLMERYLKAKGYRVFLTRRTDTTLSLKERPLLARKWKADVFVSVHLNSATEKSAAGIETFVLSLPGHRSTNDTGKRSPSPARNKGNANDQANACLGFAVQKAMIAETKATDRGVRRARFFVLKEAPCPAVLVEGGFLSNSKEAGHISVPYYRERLARLVASGVDSYLNDVNTASVLAKPEKNTSAVAKP